MPVQLSFSVSAAMPPLTFLLKYSKGENWEGEKRWGMKEMYFLVPPLVNGAGCAYLGAGGGMLWRYSSWGWEGPWQVPGSSSEGDEWLGGKRGAAGTFQHEPQHPQRGVLQAQRYCSHVRLLLGSLLVFFFFKLFLHSRWIFNFSSGSWVSQIFFLIAWINVKHAEEQHESAGPLSWCRRLQLSRLLKVLAETAHQPLSSRKYSKVCAGSI